MNSAALRPVLQLLLRFGLIYALLILSSVRVPLFQQLERPLVGAADTLLDLGAAPGVDFRLDLAENESRWAYELTVERAGDTRHARHDYHPHAYTLLLFVVLVLATPSVRLGVRLSALLVGGALTLILCVGLLLSDVQAWDEEIFGTSAGLGALDWAADAFDSIHRSTAATLLPVLLWLLYVASRSRGDRGEADPTPDSR